MSGINFVANDWPSSQIRAYQIAMMIGAKVYASPKDEPVDPNSIVIFIKKVPSDNLLDKLRNKVYVDVVDCVGDISWLSRHPEVGVIATSKIAQRYLASKLGRKDIVLIPQQSCNFEDNLRDVRRPVKRVGYCGYTTGLLLDTNALSKALANVGLELVTLMAPNGYTDFGGREGVCKFYESIDIQICYRDLEVAKDLKYMKNCLKLVNAGSFGIPTVAYPELAYVDEFNGGFLMAQTPKELVRKCELLAKNPSMYGWYAGTAYTKSLPYRIEVISDMYSKLIENSSIKYLSYDFDARIRRRGSEHMNVPIAAKNLIDVTSIFNSLECDYFLVFGTLLGMYRDKKLISYDRDTDIGVFKRDKTKIDNIIRQLEFIGFRVIRTDKHTITIMREDEYIDIHTFEDRGDRYFMSGRNVIYNIEKRLLYPIKYITDNDNNTYCVPNNCEALLSRWYGKNWRAPIENYQAKSD